MGNLSNQYISQSFQSLLHLGSDNTASATFAEIQDALGNGVGVFVNTTGNLRVTNAVSASAVSASTISGFGNPVSYSASVSDQLKALENITSSLISKTGSYATTGSNNFIGNQTIAGDLEVSGQLRVSSILTTQETASIIFSSGSNILGDSIADIQTLNGLVRVSGSSQITGSVGMSDHLTVKFSISSSTIVGIGNVTNYSASVFNEIYTLNEQNNLNVTKWATLEPVTSSLINQVYSIEQFTASQQTYNTNNNTKWTTLGNLSGSFARNNTSNSFTGSQAFTGSIIVTGSVYGNIVPLTITSQTASMNLSTSNFFTLTLVSGSATTLNATNIRQGQTINLRVTQPSVGFGTLTFGSSIKQSATNPYSATTGTGSVDIITFVSFDSSNLYAAAIKNLI